MPMVMNIQRQPRLIISTVRMGGASAGPSEEVQFQMPVGRPRSRTLYQSRTTRTAEENIGASPRPRKTRAMENCQNEPTKPAAAWASDHRPRPVASSRCGPTRSTSAPPGSCAKA